MENRVRFTSLLALVALSAGLAHADEVSVAVAANFTGPMKLVAAAFEKETGNTVAAAYGATGKFYAQIKNGAPFEILLAADDVTPARLVREGDAVAGSAFTYAVGQLVLWSAQPGLVDSAGAVLKSGAYSHLSVADPRLAPYGAAALAVLKSLGLYEQVQAKMVTAENIGQAYQFVSSGNAEIGFVALSQVLVDGKIAGSVWRIPAALYPPICQDAVLLQSGRDQPAARAFLQYLRGPRAIAIMQSSGYDIP